MDDSPKPAASRPTPSKNTAGPGIFIAALTIGGAIGGGYMGDPALGMVAGFLLGCGIGLVMWLLSRK